jgi:hypothetical protein
MNPIWLILFLLVGCTSLGGCSKDLTRSARTTPSSESPNPRTEPWFKNADIKWRVDAINHAGPKDSFFMPRSMGNGAALLDADGDGRLDIFFLNSGQPGSEITNQLFLQLSPGRFQNCTAGSGVENSGIACGVAVGDVDNDGRPDIFVSEYGGLKLFLNQGGGRFQDRTLESGLQADGWGASASFFDFNRDGQLDIVLSQYVSYSPDGHCYNKDDEREFCGPRRLDKAPALLFRNDTLLRGSPRFTNVSKNSGLAGLPGPGLGVLCADFNGDAWDDIFITNDQQANHLWINQQDGTFAEEAVLRGVATDVIGATAANMGIAWGDVDGDGLDDLFVTHLRTEMHTLWKQGPPGQFTDATAKTGITQARRATGFGTVFADFDLDGDLDLAWVNGRVQRGPVIDSPSVTEFWKAYAEPNDLLENTGEGFFLSIADANSAFCEPANVARPLCAGDIDNDGDVDLVVGITDGRPALLENTATRKGTWLSVKAIDAQGNRDAHGAVIEVQAKKRRWRRLVQPGRSYLSSHDPRVFFGFGELSEIDAIVVRWPSGTLERFDGGATNRHVVIKQGNGVPE